VPPTRRIPHVAYLVCGACVCLLTVSWTSLWWVERPTSKLGEMEPGTFLEFVGNLPRALENLSTPQTPEVVLTILPTVFLWQNVRVTFVILGVGAGLAWAVWWLRGFGKNEGSS
jgi:hypothetical protein